MRLTGVPEWSVEYDQLTVVIWVSTAVADYKLLAPADDVTKSSADWKGDAEYWAACRETPLRLTGRRIASPA